MEKIAIKVKLIENQRVSNTNKQDHNYADQVVITVEDNGACIPPDKAKNLFKKFYQIDPNSETWRYRMG